MTSKPEMQNIKRRRQLRARFRGIIRTVMVNKTFMSELLDEMYFGSQYKRKIAVLTRRTKKTGPLTAEEKILLRKPSWSRTYEERRKIVEIIANLRCFEMYPPKLRGRIAPYLDYMDVNAGGLVIREGSSPVYIYFILAGEIIATKKIFDTTKNEFVNKQIYILLAGDCVGEIAFMEKNEKRPFSAEVSIDAELLCLDGDVFHKILHPHLLMKWNQMRLAISKYDCYFGGWNYMQISYVCRFGEIKEYKPMETIYHKDKGILNFVYFVISGECMILQNLRTNVYKDANNKKIYQLSPSQNIPLDDEDDEKKKLTNFDIIKAIKEIPKIPSIDLIEKYSLISINSMEESHFIDVGTLRYGAVFGLGELMEDRAIMARTTVQCLLIPRFWLLEREQNSGNMWKTMAFHLNNAIPSREKLFTNFIQNKNWHEFKKQYVKKTLDSCKTGNPTKPDDIPLLCRIIETTYDDTWK